jgi:hypothetical protein
VCGGKSQQLVVDLLGVLAGAEGVADDGVFIDADQATGLADAAAFLEVGEDIKDLRIRESGIEQGCALAFGKALLTSAAGEHAAALPPVVEGHPEVLSTAAAEVGALGVLAAETAEVVGHGSNREKVFRGT